MTKIKIQNRQEKKIKKINCKSKRLSLLLIPLLSIIVIIPTVMAHCPLCTGVTIIGVGITRSLGWDDSIVGVFVGAMIVSSVLWANNLLKKKNIRGNPVLRVTSIVIASFVLTFLTLYYAGLFGLGNTHRIFGIERIVFGTLSGSVVSILAFGISDKIKKKRGKVLFNYQTMILTFGGLIFNVLLFWVIF